MEWVPQFSVEDFNRRMENAYRRISGSIGHELSRDRGNTRQLKASAAQALDNGFDYRNGPLFMRVGKGALAMSSYRPGGAVELKECAGEILREFYEEGVSAFQAAKAALSVEADAFLHQGGLQPDRISMILAAAEDSFLLPDRDEFTKAGLEYCAEATSPATLAALAGIAGFAPVLMLLRSPFLAGIMGVCAAGAAYYYFRAKRRTRAETMLNMLPRRLYDILQGALKTNVRRYSETINAAIAVSRAS